MVNVYLIYDDKKYNGKSGYEDLVSEQSLQALKDLEPNINYIPYAVSDSDHMSGAILKIKQENPHAKIAVFLKLDTNRMSKEHVTPAVVENSEAGLVDFFLIAQDKQSANPIEKPEWAPAIIQIIHFQGGLHEGGGRPLSERIINQTHKSVFKKLLGGSQPSSKSVTNQEPKPTSDPKSQKTETLISESDAPGQQSQNSILYVPPTDTAEIAQAKQKQAEREAMLKAVDAAEDQFQEGKHAMSKFMGLLEAYKKASTSLYAQSFYDDMRERLDPKPGQSSNEARFKNFYSYFFEKTNNPEITNIEYMKKMDKSRSMLRLLAGIAAVLVTIATFPIGIPVVAVIHKITGRNPLDLFNTHVEQLEKDITIMRKGKSMRFLDQASPKPDAEQEPENTSENKPS